jgi:hypothetical protein
MQPEIGSRNDDGTTTACAVCRRSFQRIGRQRFCSAACRQMAWRRRHPTPQPVIPPRSTRPSTVYECPACGTRSLGDQYCADCRCFCRRIGPGGLCPACDEPVAFADLLVKGGDCSEPS